MNKPRLEDKDKVAKVYNSKGEVCETFSFRDHGNSYLSAAQNYLMQNYDKLMAEEVEQMDEAVIDTTKKVVTKNHELLAQANFNYDNLQHSYTLYHPNKSKTTGHTKEELHNHLDKYGTDIRKPKKDRWKNYYGKPTEAYNEGAAKHKEAMIAKQKAESKHRGLTLDNGKVTDHEGNHVADVNHTMKHGYHPVVGVKMKGYDKVHHIELDHPDGVIRASLNHVADKLGLKEEVEQMDEAKWRDPKLKGKTFMNPRAVNRAPKDRSEYYGGDMNNPGELRGDEKIPLNRKGKPEDGKDRLADRANLPKRTRGGQKFPRVEPLKQAIMNKEEVEQMDEGNKENKKKKNEYVSNIIKNKLSPKVLPSLKYGRQELKKEEVEQMDEVAPPGREKQVKALKGKVDNPYAVAWASYNKGKAETKSENTMYNNMLTKLEEGRGRPPKPGSEAWKRRQSAAAAGGAHVETPHIATQLMKHADYGFKNHTYKFSDGSTHEITPTQRDTVLRKLRSMTGPGKKPEDREKMYDEINTPAGFFHHTGDKPIASKKLHPMSAQKE